MGRYEHVVNPADLQWEPHGEKFACRRKQLGAPAGGRMPGCSLFGIELGRPAFPARLHHGNEDVDYDEGE